MTAPKIETDLAGWWIVGHPRASDKHAVIDPCPLNDPQCGLDRKAVKDANDGRAVAYTIAMLDGYGDDEGAA